MRTVSEYLAKADEFEAMAKTAPDPSLKKRYDDIARCYRVLAQERERLVANGTLLSD